jgi:hypothetical protein
MLLKHHVSGGLSEWQAETLRRKARLSSAALLSLPAALDVPDRAFGFFHRNVAIGRIFGGKGTTRRGFATLFCRISRRSPSAPGPEVRQCEEPIQYWRNASQSRLEPLL